MGAAMIHPVGLARGETWTDSHRQRCEARFALGLTPEARRAHFHDLARKRGVDHASALADLCRALRREGAA